MWKSGSEIIISNLPFRLGPVMFPIEWLAECCDLRKFAKVAHHQSGLIQHDCILEAIGRVFGEVERSGPNAIRRKTRSITRVINPSIAFRNRGLTQDHELMVHPRKRWPIFRIVIPDAADSINCRIARESLAIKWRPLPSCIVATKSRWQIAVQLLHPGLPRRID